MKKWLITSRMGGVENEEGVFEGKTEKEAMEIFKDRVWDKTDETVWVGDGCAKGERGFDEWVDRILNLQIEEIDFEAIEKELKMLKTQSENDTKSWKD